MYSSLVLRGPGRRNTGVQTLAELCTVYCTREYIRGYKHKTYSNVEGAWEHWELGYAYLGMLIIRQTMDLG